MRKKKIEIPRWPSKLPANQRRPVSPPWQAGRHWLAGNSEGHRRISIFLLLMDPYSYYEAWDTGIKEVAFF